MPKPIQQASKYRYRLFFPLRVVLLSSTAFGGLMRAAVIWQSPWSINGAGSSTRLKAGQPTYLRLQCRSLVVARGTLVDFSHFLGVFSPAHPMTSRWTLSYESLCHVTKEVAAMPAPRIASNLCSQYLMTLRSSPSRAALCYALLLIKSKLNGGRPCSGAQNFLADSCREVGCLATVVGLFKIARKVLVLKTALLHTVPIRNTLDNAVRRGFTTLLPAKAAESGQKHGCCTRGARIYGL